MKMRLMICALAAFVLPSYADQLVPASGVGSASDGVVVEYDNGNGKYVRVTPSTPLPVTSSGGGSTTGGGSGGTVTQGSQGTPAQSWYVEQTDGTNVLGTAAHPTIAQIAAGTASIGSISNTAFGITGNLPGYATAPTFILGAGSAIAGKFDIDQTTPGTTNGVVINSGAVTATLAGTSAVNESQLNGVAVAVGSGASNTGTERVILSTDSPLPTGAATAGNQTNVQSAAGTSASTLLTVQGSVSGVPVPVSGTITTTPSGTQTVTGSVAISQTTPGTTNNVTSQGLAATNAPTLTSGNYAPLSLTVTGSLRTDSASEDTALSTANGYLSSLVAGTPTLGQKASAASTPVVIASDQSAVPVTPTVLSLATTNGSGTIATGGTFQTIAAASTRNSLEFQNNNTSDACYVYLGSGTATIAKSIKVAAGQEYLRAFGAIPNDAVQATCVTTNDTFYLGTQ
jgi:hypothetical protein